MQGTKLLKGTVPAKVQYRLSFIAARTKIKRKMSVCLFTPDTPHHCPFRLPRPLTPATATTNITNMKVNLNNELLIDPEKEPINSTRLKLCIL